MRIRRFYRKGVPYKYTFTDEYYDKLVLEKGLQEADRLDTAEKEIVLESDEEEREWFFDCLNRVIANPRYYLDNYDKIPTFNINIKKIFPKKLK